MIAPNKNAIGHESVGTNHLTMTATPHTVVITRPKAKNEIGRIFFLNSFHEVKYAAANKIGGSSTKKITSLSTCTVGTPGMNATARLPASNVNSNGR